jgi:hypothetical protein
MKTTISKIRNGRAYWSSSSHGATTDDPCKDHAANIGETVYTALEDAWDGERAEVQLAGEHYVMTLDDEE